MRQQLENFSVLDLFYQNVCHLPRKYLTEVLKLMKSYQESCERNKDTLIQIGKYTRLETKEKVAHKGGLVRFGWGHLAIQGMIFF